MAEYTLEFRDKAGTYSAVDLGEEESGSLVQQFEDEEHRVAFDALSLKLGNTSGEWDAILTTANLPPTDYYPAKYGFRVKLGGTVIWEGDLDYDTVKFAEDRSFVNVTVDDALSRLQSYNAESFKRDYSSISIVTGTKHSRKLTVNSVLDAGGEPLTAGDIIKIAHVKPNSNILEQELKVKSVDTGTNEITFKKRLKANYTAGDAIVVDNPWYRGKTAHWLIDGLLDAANWDAAKRSISYSTATFTDIVDIADFKGKTIGDAVADLASFVNSTTSCDVDTLIISERNETGVGSVIPIDNLFAEDGLQPEPVGAERYDLIKLTGTDDRTVKVGVAPLAGSKMEKSFPFTDSYTRLRSAAERLYDYWSRYREAIPGIAVYYTAGLCFNGRVSIGGVEYRIVKYERDLENADVVILDLKAQTGILPDTSLYEDNQLETDDEDPPPPLNFTMTKSYSSMFNSLWPASDYPRLKTVETVVTTAPGNTDTVKKQWRLYELRWTYPYDETIPVWRFHVTIWKDGKDRDTEKKHKTVMPVIQSDGYYYAKVYLPAGKLWWADVFAKLDDLRESEISDENSSAIDDDEEVPPGSEYTLPVITGCTLASSEDDVSGTAGVECNLTAAVSWTGTASHIRVKVVAPANTYYHTFEADASGETFEFPRMFKRGKSLHVYVRAWNVGKKTDWYDAGTITSGGAAIPTPQVPVIASVDRAEQSATVNITLTGSGTDVTSIGKLVVYQAPAGTTGDPTSNTAWHKVCQLDIAEDVAAGIRQWEAQIAKPLRKKKSFIVKAISKYDTTVKSWSSIYNEASASNIFTGISVTVVKEVLDSRTKKYTLTFSALVARMVKIKVCKSASSTTPDPTRLQPHIDTLDYALDPPECNSSTFSTEVTHAEGANPAVWFQPVGDNGDKMPTAAGVVNGWFCVDVGGATAERLAGPQDGSNSITTAIKDAGRKVTLNYPGGVPANYSTIKVFCIAGSSPPSWDRSSGEIGEWGSELVALGNTYVKNIAKAGDNLSVSFEVLQYYSGGSYHAFTAANDLSCCFLVCLVDNSSPAVDGYWGSALRPGSTASFGTPEIVSITRGSGTATLVVNYPSTGTPTSMGVVVRTLNPYVGATPANSPTTWASYSPQTYFAKATITGQAESGRKALTGSPMTIVVTGIVDTAVAFAVCVGIDGTGYGAWGLGYDAGSGGGGGGTPPTPVMANIGSSLVSLQFTWSDGIQYQVQMYYGNTSSASTYLCNSGGLVSSGWTKGVASGKYYKARLERLSDGVVGEFCTAVRY